MDIRINDKNGRKQEVADINNALIVFTKNPILGKVKTRIAESCGNKEALEIYHKLLEINANLITELTEIKTLIVYNKSIENQIYKGDYIKEIQSGSNLGEKMLNAFIKCKQKGYENIVIIGSDCPYLTPDIIQTAFEKLKTHSVVIGPSNDGGYYLLGMKNINQELFKNKKWSTDSVLNDTIKNIEESNESYFLMDKLSDIDLFEDWLEYKNQLNI